MTTQTCAPVVNRFTVPATGASVCAACAAALTAEPFPRVAEEVENGIVESRCQACGENVLIES